MITAHLGLKIWLLNFILGSLVGIQFFTYSYGTKYVGLQFSEKEKSGFFSRDYSPAVLLGELQRDTGRINFTKRFEINYDHEGKIQCTLKGDGPSRVTKHLFYWKLPDSFLSDAASEELFSEFIKKMSEDGVSEKKSEDGVFKGLPKAQSDSDRREPVELCLKLIAYLVPTVVRALPFSEQFCHVDFCEIAGNEDSSGIHEFLRFNRFTPGWFTQYRKKGSNYFLTCKGVIEELFKVVPLFIPGMTPSERNKKSVLDDPYEAFDGVQIFHFDEQIRKGELERAYRYFGTKGLQHVHVTASHIANMKGFQNIKSDGKRRGQGWVTNNETDCWTWKDLLMGYQNEQGIPLYVYHIE